MNEILVLDESAMMDLPCPEWEGPAELHFGTRATRFWFQSRRTVLQVSPACMAADVEAGGLSLKIPKGERIDRTSSCMKNCTDRIGYCCIRTNEILYAVVSHQGLVSAVPHWDTGEEN